MKSINRFTFNQRYSAAIAIMAAALTGCSTVKDISPFGSNVPYAQDISPTMPRPASPEIPVYKAAPPALAPTNSAVLPPPVSAQPKPAEPAPTVTPSAPAPQSSITPAPVPTKMADAAPKAAESAASQKPKGEKASSDQPADDSEKLPTIPEADRTFKDDGTYPNLAQVPSRPVNMPTFLEASTVEKTLIANREKAKDSSPDSPAAPSVDSVVAPVSNATDANAVTPAKAISVNARIEDGSPCLLQKPVTADPTIVLHFNPGSAALTTDDLQILSESLPTVRQGKGTIRILGHGDTEPGSAQAAGRFDLATSRAGAVAQALAGYGIPVIRIALGVACTDAATAGASVQLYASES